MAARRIWTLDRSEIVHVHLAEKGSFVREGALVALARRLGMPTIVTIHGSGFRPFAERHRLLTSLVLRQAHAITCLDEKVAALVRALAPSAKVCIVPNPVELDQQRTSARGTEEVVLFGGLVGLRKGADVLCEAWRIVAASRPRARCVVAGPTGDFSFPVLERLELRGAVASEEMQGLIRAARVVALPSRAEGMPMILTEAMGAGRPFVSTPVGGIPALALHGGVLVDVDDHEALAGRLLELLASPDLAAEIGDRGRDFCKRTRSVEVVGGHMAELYEYARAAASQGGVRRFRRALPSKKIAQ